MGYAWFTVLIVLLTSPYLDVYDEKAAWWVLCLFIFVVFVGISFVYQYWVIKKNGVDLEELFEHEFSKHTRLIKMVYKGYRWVFGIALCTRSRVRLRLTMRRADFTLKKQFKIFAEALDGKDVDVGLIVLFALSVSIVSLVILTLIERFLSVTWALRHALEYHPGDTLLSFTTLKQNWCR